MTRTILPLTVILSTVSASPGALIGVNNLYNTGVDDAGVPLAEDTPDPHYTFDVPPPTGTVPVAGTGANGFPIAPGGPWLGDNGTSAWLTPVADTQGDAGNYVYRTTFTIPVGVDLSQVFVKGRLTSDNGTTGVLINGASTGITGNGDFTVFGPEFAIARGFVHGTNTLDFIVNEASGASSGSGGGGYSGLRVEMAGSHAPLNHTSIPGLLSSGATAIDGMLVLEDSVVPGISLAPGSAVAGPVYASTSAGGFPIGPWLGDTPDSTWVSSAPDTNGPEGIYRFEINFDMTGLDTSTAQVYGQWAVDNEGVDILLNGVSTGNGNPNGFGAWTPFDITAAGGDAFLPGINTLTFVANNLPASNNPVGVRWEFLSATAVPEPSGSLLALLGLGGLMRRRR